MLLGNVLKRNTPYSEILGPRILLQIHPFLSAIVDEGGVISSLTLHPPGVFTNIVWFFEIYNKTSAERFRAISF